MLVDNPFNMLSEALRVTSPNATFGFTIWGRKFNMVNFEILETVLYRHNLLPDIPPIKTPYDINKDPNGLEK